MPKVGRTFSKKLVVSSGADIKPEPRVKIKITKRWLIIYPVEKRFDPYEFTLDRIDSPLKLLGWVEHLSGKVWMKALDLRDLIIAVSQYFEWDIFNA
jgi:hypothetical protein